MKRANIAVRVLFVCGFLAVLAGCAGPAPNYAPSIDNVETLKKSGSSPVQIGSFMVDAGMPGASKLQLRAFSMQSPVGNNYADYLANALRTELDMAKLYAPQSGISLSGVLLKNNIDAGGLSTNAGQIEARFTVKRGDQIGFDKTKAVTHEWKSAFAGNVAIPLAANNYATLVQKLVDKLITDPEFVASLKP